MKISTKEHLDYRENLAQAIKDMLDRNESIYSLSKLTGIHRAALTRLIKKEKPTITIAHLYKLMEHGMELNSLQVFLDRIKREQSVEEYIHGNSLV